MTPTRSTPLTPCVSAGTQIVWSSGRAVLVITLITQGARPELSRAGLLALAGRVQKRA